MKKQKNKKNPIGEKSYKFVVLQFILCVVCVLSIIIGIKGYIETFVSTFILLIIILFIVLCMSFYILVATLIKPKYIIEYDESGIYLNYSKKKTIYILIRDIEYIEAHKIPARYITYSFGYLIIKTKQKKYKVGVIKNLKQTENYIHSRIAYKFKW